MIQRKDAIVIKILFKSTIISLVFLVGFLVFRQVFHTELLIADIGVIGVFASFFGVLFGILSAFVVFEVWGQYNKSNALIEKEAMNLEKVYRLTVYFRDKKLISEMKACIEKYIQVVSTEDFVMMEKGKRSVTAGKVFREISTLICNIKFDDNHDEIVFNHILSEYNTLADVRSERMVQCLSRLPGLLRMFLYVSSLLASLVLLVVPVVVPFYGLFCVGGFVFILSLILQLVEDLDNPFTGYWNLNIDPYQRALKHIQNDY